MDAARDETDAERMDRNWSELLQELRVTQTGVQLLSGFLLTLPFQSRFPETTPTQRVLFLTALVLSVIASGLLIAPVSAHRLLFRRHQKDILVTAGNRLAKAGLVALGMAVTTILALIFAFVVGDAAAWVAAAVTLVFLLVCWVAFPISLARHPPKRPPTDASAGSAASGRETST